MCGNIIGHARGGHACAKTHLCNPPISSYTLQNYSCSMKLLVADNINFVTGLVIFQSDDTSILIL